MVGERERWRGRGADPGVALAAPQARSELSRRESLRCAAVPRVSWRGFVPRGVTLALAACPRALLLGGWPWRLRGGWAGPRAGVARWSCCGAVRLRASGARGRGHPLTEVVGRALACCPRRLGTAVRPTGGRRRWGTVPRRCRSPRRALRIQTWCLPREQEILKTLFLVFFSASEV